MMGFDGRSQERTGGRLAGLAEQFIGSDQSRRRGRLVVVQTPAFATDRATGAYYEQRAGESDEWYRGEGLFALRNRPGWSDEVVQLVLVCRRQGSHSRMSPAAVGRKPHASK